MTRRSVNSPEKKTEGTAGRKRKAVKPAVQPAEEQAEGSRPKRNARKSVLFTSGEYEVNYPGTVKEEADEDGIEGGEIPPLSEQNDAEAHAVDIPIHMEKAAQPSVAENPLVGSVTRGRPRRQAPQITPITHQEQIIVQDGPREIVMQMEVNETVELIQEEEENGRDLEQFDIDHLGQEVDVETMSNLEELDHEEMMKAYQFDDEMMSEQGDEPPLLERAGDTKRRRGRPRKYPQGQTPFRRTNLPNQRRSQVARDPTAPSPRNKYTYDKPLTKVEAEKINSFNVKLFEDQIMATENGDVYATVIPGCLSYLLRKERIIELLTNRNEIQTIREQGWMMNKPPRLPPLTTAKTCYAFYIDGSSITSIRDLSTDDLKPWTTSSNDPSHNEPVVKPNVRKHPIIRQGGRLVPTKGDPRSAEIHLTEYSAWLPRCLRLRKKIFYLARAGHIIGNVLILYDFTTPGDIPILLNVIHGNEAFRGSHTDEEFERGHVLFVGDNENPFEEEMVEGPRLERFFSVRPDRYGWTNNKKLLLKWLINEPQLLEQSDFLNHRIPYLPPLIEGRGVFVFFAPASLIGDQLHFTGDGLSPWTYQGASVNHRVRTVKKALVQDESGQLVTSKEEWQSTGMALVETITILCRCPRLRKRIIYVQRANTSILGNVCWIYEYMQAGPIPEIVKTNNRASNAVLAPPPEQIMLRANHNDKPDPRLMNDDDVDVEELVEEVVTHDDMGNPTLGSAFTDSLEFEDLPEDSLNAGWDTEFEEDVLVSQESSSPFFEGVRSLEDGHTYLTVRHKRVLCNTDTILEFIANSDFVDEKGLMNTSKPSHPPLVRNARAYVFFVNGHVVFPHDINRDDFSPWSANATPDRPTCYRSKVRKYGIVQDPKSRRYVMQEGDYKMFPYHLVSLYSIHPKEDRLRKRIHYLMETATKVIISHVMIMYDYNQEGSIPRINGPYGKRMIRRRPLRRLTGDMSEVLEDVSDESESEKPSPFSGNAQTLDSGETYLVLDDIDFLQDRNRQLHYLYNKPYLLEQLGCVNNRIPQFPPMLPGRGAFVFFIDGQVDSRMLTCDGLGPWSENYTHTDGSVICRRPKTHRISLGLNQNSQLRVIRGKKFPLVSDGDYQLHVYAATLPRCHRLKKRVVYITKDNQQIGMAMIAYWYSEDGEIPQPVIHGNSVHTDNSFIRLPQPVKEEAKQLLLNQMSINDVVKELSLKHNMAIHPRTINFLKRELRQAGLIEADLKIEGVAGFDVEDSMADYVPPDWAETSGAIEEDVSAVRGRRQQTGHQQSDRQDAHLSNQLFRYVKNLVGARTEDEAFDHVWKALVLKNEQRVLRNIKSDFGVEIVADQADADQMVEDGTIIEGEIVEEEILDEGQILEDVVMDDSSMILMRDEGQGGILIQEAGEGSDAVPKSDDVE